MKVSPEQRLKTLKDVFLQKSQDLETHSYFSINCEKANEINGKVNI